MQGSGAGSRRSPGRPSAGGCAANGISARLTEDPRRGRGHCCDGVRRACRCGRLSRLSLNFRQRRIHTSPTRRGCCPDIGGGSGQFLIVESASPDYQEVGTAIGCTEKRGSASRTKAAAHGITAVGGAPIIADLTCDLYPFGLEYSVDGGVTGGEIAAVSTPTRTGHDGRFVAGEGDGAAKASTGYGHWGVLPLLRQSQYEAMAKSNRSR